MKYRELAQAEKDELVGTKCFLNDEPAQIYGRLLDFPIVAQINSPLEVEYAWKSVQRIIDGDGKFVA